MYYFAVSHVTIYCCIQVCLPLDFLLLDLWKPSKEDDSVFFFTLYSSEKILQFLYKQLVTVWQLKLKLKTYTSTFLLQTEYYWNR